MTDIQDSELLQLIHEQQTPMGLKQLNQHLIFNLSSSSCFLLSVSLSVIVIAILTG